MMRDKMSLIGGTLLLIVVIAAFLLAWQFVRPAHGLVALHAAPWSLR